MKRYVKKALSVFLICVFALSVCSAVSAAESTGNSTAGSCLIDTSKAKATLDLGTWSHEAPLGADHVQGICVDDEGKYMYASFTNMLVKLDIETGEIVATMTGLVTGTHVNGAHLGDITYYNGKIYGSLEYKAQERWYLAVIDTEKLTGMDTPYTTEGLMSALYLPQVVRDYTDDLNAGEHNNSATSMGHRYGCGGIDGITVGKLPGGGYDTDGDGTADVSDTDDYIMVAQGPFGNAKRYDNEHQIIMVYDPQKITTENLLPFNEASITKEYTAEEEYRYEHKMFLYVGNIIYGVQELEYDRDTGDIWIEGYGRPDGSEFPDYSRMLIDGTIPLKMETVEVGQSVTGDADGFVTQAEAHERAALYTDYEDADGDGDYEEQETGWHIYLKCMCGSENHEAEVYGQTGKACMVCGSKASYDTGFTSLGGNLFYGVTHSNFEKDGVTYYGGTAQLVRVDRSSMNLYAVGAFPFTFEDYESKFYQTDGFGGSKNAALLSVAKTSDYKYRSTSLGINQGAAKEGDTLRFSAWIKMNNSAVANENMKLNFIVWGTGRAYRTSDDTSLTATKEINSWIERTATATGAKKGEWIQVTYEEVWNGCLYGRVPKGYNNVTAEDGEYQYLPPMGGFTRLELRVHSNIAADDVQTIEYSLDDVSLSFEPSDAKSTDTTESSLLRDGSMSSKAVVEQWSSAATFVNEVSGDGSTGYMRFGNSNGMHTMLNPGNVLYKPNHLYKYEFWARIAPTSAVSTNTETKGGVYFLQLPGDARIVDLNGETANYPGFWEYSSITTEWKKFTYYYTREYKTYAEKAYTTWLRFFDSNKDSTTVKTLFDIDGFTLTDMGPLTNGDFTQESGTLYRNTGGASALTNDSVFGWTAENATNSVENCAMKVDVTSDGGRVYQGIHMENGGFYKLTFRARAEVDEAKPFAAVLDRAVENKGQAAEVYDVPDYQYITGKNDVGEEYTTNGWTISNEWNTYECYVSNEFATLSGKTAASGVIPRTPFLSFNVDGNKAGTVYYISDVTLEPFVRKPTVSNAQVNGSSRPGDVLTFDYSYSSPVDADVSCVRVRIMNKTSEGYATLATVYSNDEYVIPESMIGKNLYAEFVALDADGRRSEPVYVALDAPTEDWAKIYYDEATNTARVYASYPVEGKVIFASYQDKQLLDVKEISVSIAAANGSDTATPENFVTDSADSVKVMFWKDECTPLCKCIALP